MIVTFLDDATAIFMANGLLILILFLALVNIGFDVLYVKIHKGRERSKIKIFQGLMVLIGTILYLVLIYGNITIPSIQSVMIGRIIVALLLIGYLVASIVDL